MDLSHPPAEPLITLMRERWFGLLEGSSRIWNGNAPPSPPPGRIAPSKGGGCLPQSTRWRRGRTAMG